MKTQRPTATDLSPLELRRKITVREAAEINGISEQTFRRYHRHLIRKISARRDAVELRHALELPPPAAKQVRA
jgi:DNA-binding CsgD family transcriptional regulator